MDVKLKLDDPPTHEEIKKATMQLKMAKSPGTDCIQAKVYQFSREAVLDQGSVHKLLGERDLKSSVMQSLSLYTKTREKSQTVHITEASPFSPLWAKSWLASC